MIGHFYRLRRRRKVFFRNNTSRTLRAGCVVLCIPDEAEDLVLLLHANGDVSQWGAKMEFLVREEIWEPIPPPKWVKRSLKIAAVKAVIQHAVNGSTPQ